MIKKGNIFHVGKICQESGVYRLKNCICKSCKCVSEDQITIPLVKGKRFPPCRNCQGDVVWEFIKKA